MEHILPTELWLEIFSYLTRSDIQQLRWVCTYWKQLTNLPKFKKNLNLKITKYNVQHIKKYLQTQTSHMDILNYESMELLKINQRKICSDLEYILQHIGRRVRHLKLNKSVLSETMSQLMPNIEELHIISLRKIPECEYARAINLNNFRRLKCLHLNHSAVSRSMEKFLLQQLICGITVLKMEELTIEYTSDLEMLILQLLETHASTLRYLDMNMFLPSTTGNELWTNIVKNFSMLHTIKLTGVCYVSWLNAIFHSIPAEAPLRNVDLSGLIEANDVLLQYIVQKWPLEQLELMFCVNIGDAGMRALSHVRSSLLLLNISFCHNISNCFSIVEGLASERNTVLQHFYLNDIPRMSEECVCVLAERLPCLTTFSLEAINDGVTDKSLSYIFRHQTRLRRLFLNDCKKITDEGFVDNGDGTTQYPITRVRGLQVLHLRGCLKVSNRLFTADFNLPELRDLKLGYCIRISADGMEALVQQCPAIETLVISSCLKIDHKAIYYVAKGLKRLRRLNASNCAKLSHERIVEYLVKYCFSLEVLTMWGMDIYLVAALKIHMPRLREVHLTEKTQYFHEY